MNSYLGMEGGREVITQDTNIKQERRVGEVHAEGDLGVPPVDKLVVRKTCALHGGYRVESASKGGLGMLGQWREQKVGQGQE